MEASILLWIVDCCIIDEEIDVFISFGALLCN